MAGSATAGPPAGEANLSPAARRDAQHVLDGASRRRAAGWLTLSDAAKTLGVGLPLLRGLVASGQLSPRSDGCVQVDAVRRALGSAGHSPVGETR